MLATLVGEPFHEPGWVYEEKYDGIRILAYKEGAQVTLLSRNDKNRTGSFPAIARTVGALRPATLTARRRSHRTGSSQNFTLPVAAAGHRPCSLRSI